MSSSASKALAPIAGPLMSCCGNFATGLDAYPLVSYATDACHASHNCRPTACGLCSAKRKQPTCNMSNKSTPGPTSNQAHNKPTRCRSSAAVLPAAANIGRLSPSTLRVSPAIIRGASCLCLRAVPLSGGTQGSPGGTCAGTCGLHFRPHGTVILPTHRLVSHPHSLRCTPEHLRVNHCVTTGVARRAACSRFQGPSFHKVFLSLLSAPTLHSAAGRPRFELCAKGHQRGPPGSTAKSLRQPQHRNMPISDIQATCPSRSEFQEHSALRVGRQGANMHGTYQPESSPGVRHRFRCQALPI